MPGTPSIYRLQQPPDQQRRVVETIRRDNLWVSVGDLLRIIVRAGETQLS
jgi:hypothetical protein